MQDAFTPHYRNDAVHQFRGMKALAEGAMAQISDEELFTALDEEDNSIAVILKHMAGSMQARWTAFPSSSDEPPGRNRDSEFAIDEGDTKKALIDRWEAGWQYLFDALEPLTAEDMAKTVRIRGRSLSVIEAINRQLTHYAYHVGQIVFLAKHFRSGAWQSLSIPRGKSEEFTAAARRRGEA
ncbi:MAG: DUF1572 family protein [Candidatus Entotheonellia bacterium]